MAYPTQQIDARPLDDATGSAFERNTRLFKVFTVIGLATAIGGATVLSFL